MGFKAELMGYVPVIKTPVIITKIEEE